MRGRVTFAALAMMRLIAMGPFLLCGWACGIIGPSCLDRQETGPVTMVTGEVAPGELNVHQVPYGTQGSQNNARISWVGQDTVSGPQIRFYATKVGCEDFSPPPATWTFTPDHPEFLTGTCRVLSIAGSIAGHIAPTFSIANGRGNPDILGSPAEYKIWVVGDPEQSARYSITITWFYGPDC